MSTFQKTYICHESWVTQMYIYIYIHSIHPQPPIPCDVHKVCFYQNVPKLTLQHFPIVPNKCLFPTLKTIWLSIFVLRPSCPMNFIDCVHPWTALFPILGDKQYNYSTMNRIITIFVQKKNPLNMFNVSIYKRRISIVVGVLLCLLCCLLLLRNDVKCLECTWCSEWGKVKWMVHKRTTNGMK